MPFCENCGNNLSDTAKFCPNCGEKIYSVSLTSEIGNSKLNKYDLDGYKQGDWIEYLIEESDKEVLSSEANLMRKINYRRGMPVGKVRDYYHPSGKLQSEFELTSGPYNKHSERPKDKYYGVHLLLDEENGTIIGTIYYDENGDIDIRKTIDIAYPNAKQDSRFDEKVFMNSEFGQELIDEFIKKVNLQTLINVVSDDNCNKLIDGIDENSQSPIKPKDGAGIR